MSTPEKQREYYNQYLRAVRGHQPLVPRDRAHRHILTCRDIGMPVADIARRAGVSQYTIFRVLREPEGLMRSDVAHQILNVIPARPITAIGVTRRIRALSALGWSVGTIADAAGVRPETVKAWRRGEIGLGPTPATPALLRAYDTLSMRRPPQRTPHERASAARVANVARRNGWAPPLAWDDDTIDDLTAQPEGAGYREPTALEYITELAAQGLTQEQIAAQRGVQVDSVKAVLYRAQKNGQVA